MFRKIGLLLTALTLFISCASAPKEKEESISDKVIRLHLDATGARNIKNVKNFKAEMTAKSTGMEIPLTMYSQKPDKIRMEMEAMGMEIVTVINKKEAWVEQAGNITDLPPEQIKKVKEQMNMTGSFDNIFLDYTTKGTNIEYKGLIMDPVDSLELHQFNITDKDSTKSVYFITPNTYMAYKMISWSDVMGGMNEFTTYFSEYKQFGNMKFPSNTRVNLDGSNINEVFIKNIEFNIDMEEKLFQKPE